MTDDNSSTETYRDWKADIRRRIEANEGHESPDAEELWNRAGYAAEGASEWIRDMPLTENEIRAAKGDVLNALVALEMAEERLEEHD